MVLWVRAGVCECLFEQLPLFGVLFWDVGLGDQADCVWVVLAGCVCVVVGVVEVG